MSKQFSKGETVVLKSGSPLMTVNGYKRLLNPDGTYTESSTSVECIWFQGEEKKTGTFHQDTLVKEDVE